MSVLVMFQFSVPLCPQFAVHTAVGNCVQYCKLDIYLNRIFMK